VATFVLVHGSWHAAWCWEKVTPLLEGAGHTVVAIDLPGHGDDATPAGECTLNGYGQRVTETIDAQSEPVVLVGHSMGGIAITQAAEERPDKIARLVFLCAFLLQDGQSVGQINEHNLGTALTGNWDADPEGTSLVLKLPGAGAAFYERCTGEDVERALERLRPDPLAPIMTPVHTTEANFGRVPRVYIECLADRAIVPALQKQMYTALACDKVITMDADHSPFYSAPEELADHLLSLV
jgi:pimeloyl-ACP methyl ester carboxylesterase